MQSEPSSPHQRHCYQRTHDKVFAGVLEQVRLTAAASVSHFEELSLPERARRDSHDGAQTRSEAVPWSASGLLDAPSTLVASSVASD